MLEADLQVIAVLCLLLGYGSSEINLRQLHAPLARPAVQLREEAGGKQLVLLVEIVEGALEEHPDLTGATGVSGAGPRSLAMVQLANGCVRRP